MKEQVQIKDAIKSDDWVCTKAINAGSDSYRVYESEKTNQKVIEDGKTTGLDLAYLKGKPIDNYNKYSNDTHTNKLTQNMKYIDILECDILVYSAKIYTVYRRNKHHIIRFSECLQKVRSIILDLSDLQATETLKLLEKTDYYSKVISVKPIKPYYTDGKIYEILEPKCIDINQFMVISDDGKKRICEFGENWKPI